MKTGIVSIETPNSKIVAELVEEFDRGATTFGIRRNGVIKVISPKRFNNIIQDAQKSGFRVFDYR